MDFDTAARIWIQMRSTRCVDLKEILVDTAIRYAQYRVEWLRADPDRQAMVGADRSAYHNALISACDALARNMAKVGEDASWRKTMGDDRKRIGDFACFLHCLLGLSAR